MSWFNDWYDEIHDGDYDTPAKPWTEQKNRKSSRIRRRIKYKNDKTDLRKL